MPLSLPPMNVAIVCDGKELKPYDVKQEGTSSLTAFIASKAGKQFKITYSNNSTDFGFCILLLVDGRKIRRKFSRAGSSGKFLGPYKSSCSILPFKFQELQLVDPDLEDAPVAPEMGTIEVKAYRCQKKGTAESSNRFAHGDPQWGRISERSKKAGWHHVATGDEIPVRKRSPSAKVDYLDSPDGPPYASIKIFYRPRELLRAQGIIPLNNVGRRGSPNKNKTKKRARDDGSPGPSRRRPKITVKSEELSEDVVTQRIQALQAELDALKAAVQSSTFVKCELRSPSC
ncbi:hypothetical protein EI94DRAFT_1699864 [Lactarius quietus]|nr:hypothetical protein EI94DRAFT_1699864 [Lactarius quietus]